MMGRNDSDEPQVDEPQDEVQPTEGEAQPQPEGQITWSFELGRKLQAVRDSFGIGREALVQQLEESYGYKVSSSRIGECERGRSEGKNNKVVSGPSEELQAILVRFYSDPDAIAKAKAKSTTRRSAAPVSSELAEILG